MPLTALDHVNVRTRDLARLTRFYEDVLGLTEGERPSLTRPGAWLYCGGHPVLHLAEAAQQPDGGAVGVDHFAFRASGLREFVAALRERDLGYDVQTVPGRGQTQVFLRDPDGNKIEVQFDAGEPLE